MDKNEKWEISFTLFVILLFAIVIVATSGQDFQVGGVPQSAKLVKDYSTQRVVDVQITQEQYVFNVTEMGAVNATFEGRNYLFNLIFAHPGEVLNLTMSAKQYPYGSATGNFYFPDYADRFVDDQIVPGLTAYDALPVPNVTGVYAFLDGEYDGPWFSYQLGELLVLPSSGYFTTYNLTTYFLQTEKAYTTGLVGDPYNPPIVFFNNTDTPVISFVGDQEGLLHLTTSGYLESVVSASRASVPAPTVIVKRGSNVTLTIYIPYPVSDNDFFKTYVNGTAAPLYNVTLGIYGVYNNGTIVPVATTQIKYNTTLTFNFNATFPAYIYGIVNPVFTQYNPDNEANLVTGEDFGLVMGAWGVILVEE
ncbi:hypothetical protein HS7_02310 [Sulfolobales archaeon HS-7]|nr:hypothetical protein HS7_02310 [Sulfolobales archaeon HS-7]